MSRFWSNALAAWLHDPPDKCLGIVGHEARARRYLEAALGRAVTQDEQTHVAAVLASAAEHLPLPPGDDDTRRVNVEDGPEMIHPLSARSDSVDVDVVDDDFVIDVIREIAAPWADSQDRFLALWRFWPERLAKERPYFDVLPADARAPDHTIWQHLDATAALAGGHWGGNAAFLSFSLGPVQSFISAARSLRDLWSGSMILSWITFKAMLPVIDQLSPTALVYPAARGLPLLDLWLDRKLHIKRNLPDFLPSEDADARRAPCLPNRFLAVVPYGSDGGEARELAQTCQRAARKAWGDLCEAVRQALVNKWAALDADWDARWHEQVDNYFDVRTAVLPWSKCDDPTLAKLLRGVDDFSAAFTDAGHVRQLAALAGQTSQFAGQWQYRMELSARLMEAARSVRHAPPATQADAAERVPPKCSLLGSFEQMGPADLAASAKFWQQAAKISIEGVKLRANERFCAVALVKRFAGPALLRQELKLSRNDLRQSDTATVAAARWLAGAGIDHNQVREEHRRWSGQWLHWARSNQDDDEDDCPPEVWRRIEAARRDPKLGRPPTYYAILMLDGDRMGDWLRGELSPSVEQVMHSKMVRWYREQATPGSAGKTIENGLRARRPVGPALHASISAALANFALHFAPRIVANHSGELIYAGGDDVLALLPAATALACARELSDTFRQEWKTDSRGRRRLLMGGRATVSAGVAVVHYKEDLRFALAQARRAEKAAKDAGRDALEIIVCRRSGEHASALCPWTFAPAVESWVKAFLPEENGSQGASDRWLYHLRQELETLKALPIEAMRAELRRQLGRADEATRKRLPVDRLASDFDVYRTAKTIDDDGQPGELRFQNEADALPQFLTLCQSASFLARGRDE